MVFPFTKSDKKKSEKKDDEDIANQIVAEKLVTEFMTEVNIKNDGDTPLVIEEINSLISEIEKTDAGLANAMSNAFATKLARINPKISIRKVHEVA